MKETLLDRQPEVRGDNVKTPVMNDLNKKKGTPNTYYLVFVCLNTNFARSGTNVTTLICFTCAWNLYVSYFMIQMKSSESMCNDQRSACWSTGYLAW